MKKTIINRLAATFLLAFLGLLLFDACKKADKNENSFEEKFSGKWRFTFSNQICTNLILNVGATPGTGLGTFPVLIQYVTKQFNLSTAIAEDGKIDIGVKENGANKGTITGVLNENGAASGTYQINFDGTNLSGSWTGKKVTDACEGLSCSDYSYCNNGTCVCDDGYEGCNCIPARQKFLGSYSGYETCSSSGSFTYPLSIVEGSDILKIEINNMGNFSGNYFVVAYLQKENPGDLAYTKLSIPKQAPAQIGDNIYFEGSGSIKGNVISGSYVNTFSDGSQETCQFTYTHQ